MLETIIPTMFTLLQAGVDEAAMPAEIGGAKPEVSTVWDMPWNKAFEDRSAGAPASVHLDTSEGA
jgi:hypothetical protein